MAMEGRNFDREFREGAVRIVREMGKPIAQVARELGLHEGTLGPWVKLDRQAREGEGPLSESERDELKRLGKETPSWRWSVMCSNARLARAVRAEAGPQIGFLRADAQRLPLRDETVDAVVSIAVLQLVPDPAAARRRWRGCCERGDGWP
jgi:transposase